MICNQTHTTKRGFVISHIGVALAGEQAPLGLEMLAHVGGEGGEQQVA